MNCWGLLVGMGALALPVTAAIAQSPRGASVPWTTYEAEQATFTGDALGPEYNGQNAIREASGRRCVRLAATGDHVDVVAKGDAQGLIVRYSIPDSPDGRGIDATLSVSINGKTIQKLSLSSRLTYLYGEYPYKNETAAGTPRHFWDEVRCMPGVIHAGDTIRLEKHSDDTAAEYLIDLIDLETVPPALQRPADSISVSDCGAKPDDDGDDQPAFLAAIEKAKAEDKSVWIPPGRFVLKGSVPLDKITIAGAGIWYTTLVGIDDYHWPNRVAFEGCGSDIHLSDFAIVGNLNYRNDDEPNDGLVGSFGTGSSIRNIWVEHTKTGAWITNSDGLLVENCRFRDTIADGINLCLGMRNTVVRNCSARGTGDDCFAMWPAVYAPSKFVAGNNRFVSCTAQLPYLAQGFSIYGGESNAVEDCVAVDIPYGAGLFASTTFPTVSGFSGTTVYQHITLTRCGGSDGAIGTVANLRDLKGLQFKDIDVIDSPTDGIKFTSMQNHALEDATFQRMRIIRPGVGGAGSGIFATADAVGSATIEQVTVENPKTQAWQTRSQRFTLVQGAGNAGFEIQQQSNAGKASSSTRQNN